MQKTKGYKFLIQIVIDFYQQKQTPGVFYSKRCTRKFCKIHRKTPVPGSLVQVSKSFYQVFSCEFCKISKNTFLTEHLLTITSVQLSFRKYVSKPTKTHPSKVQKITASRNLIGVSHNEQCCQTKYLSKIQLKTWVF